MTSSLNIICPSSAPSFVPAAILWGLLFQWGLRFGGQGYAPGTESRKKEQLAAELINGNRQRLISSLEEMAASHGFQARVRSSRPPSNHEQAKDARPR